MRKTMRFDALVTALSSISHIGEVRGVNAEFHREKIMLPNGTIERVPTITGNSIRGQLRDAGTRHMLRLLGYGVAEDGTLLDTLSTKAFLLLSFGGTLSGERQGLILRLFHFLFSGGALSKSGDALDAEQARRLIGLVPFVGLFGGAAGNYIMPGRLKMGKFMPIASETAHLLPEPYQPLSYASIFDHMQAEPYTRKDDAKDDRLREFLYLPDKNGETFTVERGADDTAPQQMRYWVETICTGTRFYWHIALENATALEYGAFVAALSEWGKYPTLGGKGSIGHGLVAVEFSGDIDLDIDPRSEKRPAVPEAYEDYLRSHADEIREVLDEL